MHVNDLAAKDFDYKRCWRYSPNADKRSAQELTGRSLLYTRHGVRCECVCLSVISYTERAVTVPYVAPVVASVVLTFTERAVTVP